LAAAAAAALPDDREEAARLLRVSLAADWPAADLLDLLPMQAAARPDDESFGVWVMIERESATVVGDIGFVGSPGPDLTVEMGYSVIPDRRRRGYATEAACLLVDWVMAQPRVAVVVAGCDVENVPSIRVLEHVGFVRTEETNKEIRWRLRRDPRDTLER
jgi:ribosomal-protein-alanine N-acetyltransferase